MTELYKGQAGSPITYLASDISAGQTTISIADDSALPPAPNICTIGYGEQLETIKYENKSNGVLQDVTRGIEGTPRAWVAGTEVARYFTAYDHLTIIDKIEENANNHMSHLADYTNLNNKFNNLNNNIKNNIQSGIGISDGVTLTLSVNTTYLFINNHGNSSIYGIYILIKASATAQIVVIPISAGGVVYEIIDNYNIKFTAPAGTWTLLTLTKDLSV
ncbi:MAG TPA: hypothetical protein VFC79_00840 [Tissierellaceae bacterium]|nr:hypothetical protein [Tissierellaceae bacterium]